MDQEIKDAIVKMYAQHVEIAGICVECGVYPPDVYRVIREYGMQPSRRRRLTRTQAAKLSADPFGVDELSGVSGVSGVSGGVGGKGADTEVALLVYQAKLSRRCSNTQLAKELGIGAGRLRALLKLGATKAAEAAETQNSDSGT
jgi:hypothetical protein